MVDNRSIYHLTLQRYHAQTAHFRLFRRRDHIARMLNVFQGWGINLMQQFNLARVDQRFAVKAEVFRQIASARKPSSLLMSDHTTS